MRVCLICEGSYPYVAGGVSSWVQMLCQSLQNVEFVIWSIATTREEMSQYKYQLPPNVVGVETIYLGDAVFSARYRKLKLSREEQQALHDLIRGKAESINWEDCLRFIKKHKKKLVDLLMSEYFYEICLEEYQQSHSTENFKEFLWSFRSMYFSLLNPLSGSIPEADLYHALSTGYAGILGSAASYSQGKPLLLSEHGIYTREREEDIIRAVWVKGGFKELWIEFFKKLSMITYQQASAVTTLFRSNGELQVELGCPREKIVTIPNGVDLQGFADLPCQNKLPKDCFNIGTVLRVVPIKYVKSMLLAFNIVREKVPEARLSILGTIDESPEYYEECLALVDSLEIPNVHFYGRVNVKDYLPEFDLLLLSSISEGQPLAILEGMAAGKPFVSTNVGDCQGLLEGNPGDDLGRAGIIVPVMDSEAMAAAIVSCARDPLELRKMGQVGRRRVETYYGQDRFLTEYRKLYSRCLENREGGR